LSNAYAYLFTPVGIAEKAGLTVRFLECKMAEYEHPQADIAALGLEVNGARASKKPC